MNGHVDVNCLLGHWPFRKLHKNKLEDLIRIHRINGIEWGYVASLNALFYNDPFEGDEELHEWIKGTSYKHVLTLNPELPGWEEDLRSGVTRFGVCGVRVYPTYHGYGLDSKPLGLLCDKLEQLGLPLFLTLRMEDDRLDYLMKPDPLTPAHLGGFLSKRSNLTIVLLNIRYHELVSLQEDIRLHPGVYFDTSGLKDGLFVVEKLLGHFSSDRILYGSQFPLFCLKSTLFLVEMAELSDDIKERILSGGLRLLADH